MRVELLALLLVAESGLAAGFEAEVVPLVEAACLKCHDADTKTELNFEALGFELGDEAIFGKWEDVYDRVKSGEMPPVKEERPDTRLVGEALNGLERELRAASLAKQEREGRVPVRRLTRKEYEYTMQDLLGIGGDVSRYLPPESGGGRFDTVAVEQGISPVHVRSYLEAADAAIDEAIELGRRPVGKPRLVDYRNSRYVAMWFEREIRRGGQTVKKVEDAVVTFDFREHTMRSDHMGIRFRAPGIYRIEAEAYGYQAKTPVTMTVMRSSEKRGGAEMIGAFDIPPGKTRKVSLTSYFTPADYFYPAVADLDWDEDGKEIFRAGGAKYYKGEGVAVKRLTIEGPLEESWPPARTRDLLAGVGFSERGDGRFELVLEKGPLEHVREIIGRLAPRAFRRRVEVVEIEGVVGLAERALEEGKGFEGALRVSLRALFSAPGFLYQTGQAGTLDGFGLAARLSYFLWKSTPDERLSRLGGTGELTDVGVLRREVERMLGDPRSGRFTEDFFDQWIGLGEIDATRPDDQLYPEYDDVLRQAMLGETKRFFRALIDEDLPVRNLVDSDFTYLNRRLAEHYGIGGVESERFRRVSLEGDSVRGGLLTQASVLKITANGTVTSPVKRGVFVLANLLGTPAKPPPADIGSIEPDTRGATTIRETLDAHRNVERCASCHRKIDPAGFALESFDPIGGFRTRYRSTEKGDWPTRKLFGRPVWEYREGLPVDTSGAMADGREFSGVRELKWHLLGEEEQVARNLIENLVVYSTGGEIEFADRDEVERMVGELGKDGFGVRSMIHAVVQSRMFKNK